MSTPDIPVPTSPEEALRLRIMTSTIPLYTRLGEEVNQASGVLFRLADRLFIVTCAHFLHRNQPLFIVRAGEAMEPRSLDGAMVTVGERNNVAVVDLGLIELPPEMADWLLPVHRFIDLTEIDATPSNRQGTYLVAGDPVAMTDADTEHRVLTTKPLAYVTGPYRGTPQPGTEYNPDVHIALIYRTDCFGPEGQPLTCVTPPGMSGCGIWRLTEGEAVKHCNPEDARLVAIQHRYSATGNYVFGSWIGLAMRMVWDRYEGLRPAMTLVFPSRRR